MYEIEGERYLSSLETARRLGVTPATLRTYRSDQRPHVPYTKVSGAVLYRESDVTAYLQRRSRA